MRLASVEFESSHHAAIVDHQTVTLLPYPDVGALLRSTTELRHIHAAGPSIPLQQVHLRPVVPHPEKLICVGLNYKSHIIEMKRELPSYPTLFAKFASTLIGPYDQIRMPTVSDRVDWEVELAVVIGRRAHQLPPGAGGDHIAGFTVMNDVTARDWQNRTTQWLQGKNFDATAPLGPWMVTAEDVDGARDLEISCTVNDDRVQQSSTRDLLFYPGAIVEYVSSLCTLEPGDVIATGTPGGVGSGHLPPRFLTHGDVLVSEIAGIGQMVNRVHDSRRPTDGCTDGTARHTSEEHPLAR